VPARSDLVGAWVVESIGGFRAIDKSLAYIEYTEDGKVGGNSSRNRFTDGYILSGSMLSFSEAASTWMMCPPALMEQEKYFTSSLEKVAQARLEYGLLLLPDSNRNLVFKASRRKCPFEQNSPVDVPLTR